MSILGKYIITQDVALPERYSRTLISKDDTVEITESGGIPVIEVCDADNNVFLRGEVAYHDAATKESIHGKVIYLGVDYYVSAYAMTLGDSVYVSGFATGAAATQDSGGQWGGNWPR
jgi:hypothetical protein